MRSSQKTESSSFSSSNNSQRSIPDAYQSETSGYHPAPRHLNIKQTLLSEDTEDKNDNESDRSDISRDIFEGSQYKSNISKSPTASPVPSPTSTLVPSPTSTLVPSNTSTLVSSYANSIPDAQINDGYNSFPSTSTEDDDSTYDSNLLSPDIFEHRTSVSSTPKIVKCSDKKELAKEYPHSCDLNNNFYDDKCNQFKLKKELIEEACFKTEHSDSKLFSPYPSLNDPEFNLKLAKKKEFNENRYDGEIQNTSIEERAEILSNADFELSPHQIFVKNFLSPDTPYNSLLLFHGLGTGKTCSAIGVCENAREYSSQLHPEIKILIVASPTVLDNFKSSLFDASKIKNENGLWTSNSCLGDKLLKEINPLNTKGLSKTHVKTEINKIIDKSYEFIGYNDLANKISNLMSSDELHNMTQTDPLHVELSELTMKKFQEEFDGRLIIIDEVHNINSPDPLIPQKANKIEEDGTRFSENSSQYGEGKILAEYLELLVRVAMNIKLLFLSATPIYEDHKDIVKILNIMNINDKRSAISTSQIFNQSGNLKSGGKELLVRKSRGYISVVKGENPYTFPYRVYPTEFDISKTFSPNNGQSYPRFSWDGRTISLSERNPIIQLYLNKIGTCNKQSREKCQSCQSCIYTNIINSLTEDPGFNLNRELIEKLLEILIITYPMKEHYDSSDYIDYINTFTGKHEFNRVMKYDPVAHKFRYREKYNGFFKPTQIGQFSSKIKNILDLVDKSEGVLLIYSDKIFSGLLPMALALEEIGFSRFEEKNLMSVTTSSAKKRSHSKYIMITGNSILSPDNKREINAITDVKNKDGSIIKVVLISGAGAEGIDFKFIRQVHILEPYFNLNRVEQVIGRAIRNLGHKDLEFSKRNVQIFMHATILEDPDVESIDLYVYRVAESRAKKQGVVTRILKETAVDCVLNHSQTNFSQEILNIKLDDKSRVRQVLSTGEELLDFKVGEPSYSASCDYMKTCYYDCSAGISSADKITDLDEDTYSEKYLKVNFDKIISKIKGMMKEGFFYKKQKIIETLDKYPRTQIFGALTYLVDHKPREEITDKYGRPGHLINLGDYYLFQPSELNNPRISLFERSTPIDQKIEMLNLVMKPNIINDHKAKIKHHSL